MMLVAGASTLLVGLSNILIERFSSEGYDKILPAHPIRIVEAIITGITFLGAGTIFRSGESQLADTFALLHRVCRDCPTP